MNKKKNKSVVLVLSLSLSVRLFLMERTKLLNSIPASQLSTFSVPPFCSAIPEADSSRSSSPSSPRFGIPKLLSQLLLVSVELFSRESYSVETNGIAFRCVDLRWNLLVFVLRITKIV